MNRLFPAVMLFIMASVSPAFGTQGMSYGRFGKLTICGDAAHADSAALFISGDDGWRALPHLVQGFSAETNRLPQFRKSYLASTEMKTTVTPRDSAQAALPAKQPQPGKETSHQGPERVDDLPLVELPGNAKNEMLAVILTGDGGWAAIDRSIGTHLAGKGISVVGFNSLKYFWKRKTPDQSAHDLQRVIGHYLVAWHKKKVVLIGYSQGADVLPFMVGRLPKSTQEAITGIALLGLARKATFEITVVDLIGGTNRNSLPVTPALQKLKDFRILCIYGREEKDTLCPVAPPPIPGWQAIEMPGGHHFDNEFIKVADLIIKRLELLK